MTREITLVVPELSVRSYLGVSCCVAPAAEAIEQSLEEWAGVETVAVDQEQGLIRVSRDAACGPSAADLLWSLRMLGLSSAITAVRAEVLI